MLDVKPTDTDVGLHNTAKAPWHQPSHCFLYSRKYSQGHRRSFGVTELIVGRPASVRPAATSRHRKLTSPSSSGPSKQGGTPGLTFTLTCQKSRSMSRTGLHRITPPLSPNAGWRLMNRVPPPSSPPSLLLYPLRQTNPPTPLAWPTFCSGYANAAPANITCLDAPRTCHGSDPSVR